MRPAGLQARRSRRPPGRSALARRVPSRRARAPSRRDPRAGSVPRGRARRATSCHLVRRTRPSSVSTSPPAERSAKPMSRSSTRPSAVRNRSRRSERTPSASSNRRGIQLYSLPVSAMTSASTRRSSGRARCATPTVVRKIPFAAHALSSRCTRIASFPRGSMTLTAQRLCTGVQGQGDRLIQVPVFHLGPLGVRSSNLARPACPPQWVALRLRLTGSAAAGRRGCQVRGWVWRRCADVASPSADRDYEPIRSSSPIATIDRAAITLSIAPADRRQTCTLVPIPAQPLAHPAPA